ncbi:hypothetical protein [Bacillus alkalicellulosilyticus]|uniref:hypothetical protein n=1 Tax=Alkalihalobacterium alkalicellulosilyticum TaxID=1912214 RepID=UPI000996D360|nr:hypothetical protein [Bacillus alkalicellulosilyticus]
MTSLYIGLYVLLTLWMIATFYLKSNQLSLMGSKTVTMALSMITGFMAGILLTVMTTYTYFTISAASIIIASLVGIIVGFPKGILVIVEGILAGVMSGMMGAMLAHMIPTSALIATVQIVAVFSVGLLFLLFLHVSYGLNSFYIFRKPLPFFTFVCLFLLLNHYSPFSIQDLPIIEEHLHVWLV